MLLSACRLLHRPLGLNGSTRFTYPDVKGTWGELFWHTEVVESRTCQVEEGHDAPFLDRKILQTGRAFGDGHVRYRGETAG